MASKIQLAKNVFDVAAGPNLIREEIVEAEWLRDVQASNLPTLQERDQPEDEHSQDKHFIRQNG